MNPNSEWMRVMDIWCDQPDRVIDIHLDKYLTNSCASPNSSYVNTLQFQSQIQMQIQIQIQTQIPLHMQIHSQTHVQIQIQIGSECSIGLVKYHVQRDTGADVWCIQQAPEPREISKYLTSLYFQQAFAAPNTLG